MSPNAIYFCLYLKSYTSIPESTNWCPHFPDLSLFTQSDVFWEAILECEDSFLWLKTYQKASKYSVAGAAVRCDPNPTSPLSHPARGALARVGGEDEEAVEAGEHLDLGALF